MKRSFLGLFVIGTMVMGAVLLQTKYTVQEKARELRELAAQIHKDREAIRVLEAEWAYRTTPSKLQEQSLEYLAMAPVSPRQVVMSVKDVPRRADPDAPVEGSVGVLLPHLGDVDAVKADAARREAKERSSALMPVLYSTRLKKIVPIQTRYESNATLRTKQ